MSRHHLPKILTSIKKRARQRCSSPSIHGALRPDERLCIPKILTFREFSPCDESRKRSPQPRSVRISPAPRIPSPFARTPCRCRRRPPKNLTFKPLGTAKPRQMGLQRLSFPETLTSRRAGIPRNLTYAPNLLKRRAESLLRRPPEKSHPCLCSCGWIGSGSVRPHLCYAPEKPHLSQFCL